jgi:hypothetical protein
MMKRELYYLIIFLLFFGSLIIVDAFGLRLFRAGQVDFEVITTGNITIISPFEGETRNFNFGDNYTFDLNVTSSRPMSFWWYTLIDFSTNEIVYSNIPFLPNITFNAVAGSNLLVVYANDSGGNIFNDSVIFFAQLNNTSPIIHNISSDIYVCEGNYLTYLFNVSDAEGDVLSSDISPKNPFYSHFSDYVNLTYFQYEIFSGVLDKEDAGGVNAGFKIYEETVSVADEEYTDSAKINITAIEINNAPEIEAIGVHTIWATGDNSTFYYQTHVDDVEDGDETLGNLIFNISFSGEELFNISLQGIMNYTAMGNVGVHNISVCTTDRGLASPYENISLCGQDGSSLTSCENFSLTITNENRAPVITGYYPLNKSFSVSGTDVLRFNVSEYDADGTVPDVYWYVGGVLKEYDTERLTNEFTYSFGCGVSGNYVFRVVATDGELNDSEEWNVSVRSVMCPVVTTGGGGGGGALYCTEKWGCGDFNQCTNLNSAYLSGKIDYESSEIIKKRCALLGHKEDNCGFQTRSCSDINKCGFNYSMPGILRECYYTENPDCFDGIKNCHDGLCEVLIDCGGPCESCPTCSDGIKNQGEEGIDCGGPCPICKEFPINQRLILSAKVIILYVFLILLVLVLIIIVWLSIRYNLMQRRLKRIKEKESSTKIRQ